MSFPVGNPKEIADSSEESHNGHESLTIDWDTVEQQVLLISDSGSSNEDDNDALIDDLANWTTEYQVNHNAVDALLKVLVKHGHCELPNTARTLLKTVTEVET